MHACDSHVCLVYYLLAVSWINTMLVRSVGLPQLLRHDKPSSSELSHTLERWAGMRKTTHKMSPIGCPAAANYPLIVLYLPRIWKVICAGRRNLRRICLNNLISKESLFGFQQRWGQVSTSSVLKDNLVVFSLACSVTDFKGVVKFYKRKGGTNRAGGRKN